MKMNEEKLISLVQEYKELYDFSDSNYHNQQCKDNIWEEIAVEMNRPVSECKKRWSTLRDSYRKSVRIQSGESAAKKRCWRYDKQMSFLRPFLVDRKQINNVDQYDSSENETHQPDTEDDSYVDADDITSPVTILSCSSTSRPELRVSAQRKSNIQQTNNGLSTPAVLQHYLIEKCNQITPETSNTSDPITKFFDCMAETVKTFPPQLQIEVKSKIFEIVTDAETKNLNSDDVSYKS